MLYKYCRCSVYLLFWYKSTNTDASDDLLDAILARTHYSVYLLSWHKSTNTDASDDLLDAILARTHCPNERRAPQRPAAAAGAQFTCCTSTKARILTQKLQGLEAVNGRLRALEHLRFRCTYFTCLTSTKLQILTLLAGFQHLSQSAHAL